MALFGPSQDNKTIYIPSRSHLSNFPAIITSDNHHIVTGIFNFTGNLSNKCTDKWILHGVFTMKIIKTYYQSNNMRSIL